MSRLDRYLLALGLPPLLFGAMLYATLAVVSAVMPRLQWIAGVPLADLAVWLVLLLPNALVQTLPIALLLAVLLTFGRLAASHELMALQAGGITLRRMMMPFFAAGAIAAAAALFMTERVVPSANARVGALYWELTAGSSGLFRLARQQVPIGDYVLYFERVDRHTDEVFGVRVTAWEGERLTVLFADSGKFRRDSLELTGYRMHTLDLAALGETHESADALMQRLLRVDTRPSRSGQSLVLTTSESVDELITRYSGGGFEDTRSLSDAYQAAINPELPPRQRLQAEVLVHRKLAEPLANLALLLVAVPVAILYARSRSIAFGLSLVVALVWYLLFTVGQLLGQAGTVPPWLGAWSANLLLIAIGCYLLIAKTNVK